jgi:hypothetical protein
MDWNLKILSGINFDVILPNIQVGDRPSLHNPFLYFRLYNHTWIPEIQQMKPDIRIQTCHVSVHRDTDTDTQDSSGQWEKLETKWGTGAFKLGSYFHYVQILKYSLKQVMLSKIKVIFFFWL